MNYYHKKNYKQQKNCLTDWATQSAPQQVIEEFRKAYTGIRKFNPSLRPRMDLRESDTERDESVHVLQESAGLG